MIKIIGNLKDGIVPLNEFIEGDNIKGFFVDYSDIDILKNSRFKTIYFNKEIITVDCELVYITNELLFDLDLIESGYKTICFLKFNKGVPKIIDELPVVDNWYDYDDPQSLMILSEQRIIDCDCEE